MDTVNIYELIDPITNETRYIGKTKHKIERRLSNHICEARKNTTFHCKAWIKSLLNKDLRPIVSLIEKVPVDGWEFWEQWYIEMYRSWGINLTNQTIGGDGMQNRKPNSGSFKKGISPWNKGLVGVSGGWKKGKPKSEELKKIISETKKSQYASGEIVNARKGYRCSEDEKIKMRLQHPNRMKTVQLNKDTLEFIKEFESRGQIQKELGFNSSNIGVAIKNNWSAYGFKWMYKKDL